MQLLSLFSGKDLEKVISLDDDELLESTAKSLSNSDRAVTFPSLMDFPGKDEYTFLALYKSRQSQNQPQWGIAFVRLE